MNDDAKDQSQEAGQEQMSPDAVEAPSAMVEGVAASLVERAMPNLGMGLMFGVIVAVVGAGLWAAGAFYTEREFGILAWALGGAVGVAVLKGCRVGGGAPALMAAVLAIFGIVAGKAVFLNWAMTSDATVKSVLQRPDAENKIAYGVYLQMRDHSGFGAEDLRVCDAVIQGDAELMKKLTPKQSAFFTDFSAALEKLTPEQKHAAVKYNLEASAAEMTLVEQAKATTSGTDILFFLLAITTAYKIANRQTNKQVEHNEPQVPAAGA